MHLIQKLNQLINFLLRLFKRSNKRKPINQSTKAEKSATSIRAAARRAMKDEPRVCRKPGCGYILNLEVAHIKALKDFEPNTPIKEINSLDNLAYLCPNCHAEYDKSFQQNNKNTFFSVPVICWHKGE